VGSGGDDQGQADHRDHDAHHDEGFAQICHEQSLTACMSLTGQDRRRGRPDALRLLHKMESCNWDLVVVDEIADQNLSAVIWNGIVDSWLKLIQSGECGFYRPGPFSTRLVRDLQ